ncbi:hypothetical protein GCM10022222_06950 [Amycolatopsis ultiminotia]|uniref:Arylsulfotransferase (ASST) n=1 Tax=Amycolatopsis ultiminotia TaxID=543629 RepID=A0ABP6V5I5_9PSEU
MRDSRKRIGTLLGAVLAAVAVATAPPAAAADGLGLDVLVHRPGTSPGFIFVAPKVEGSATAPSYAEVVDDRGRVVWSHRVPVGQQVTDFRKQTYRGKPVLTWWQGTSPSGAGHGEGTDYIADLHGKVLATVEAGTGLADDQHEFRLTSRGTALITVYHQTPADLSSVGGPAAGQVFDAIAEEIDVATGKVLLHWNSLAHVPLADSHAAVPSAAPYDYFHINAVNVDQDGNLLISARHTWTVYKVDRHTGEVIWRLGGRHSDFALGDGAEFSWQHNPLPAGPDTVRIFDNASNGDSADPSRIIWVKLDERARTATLVRSVRHPDSLSAPSQGNSQALPNGDTFVGWGQLGRVSEFGPDGRLRFDATLPAGYDTYRAYRFAGY